MHAESKQYNAVAGAVAGLHQAPGPARRRRSGDFQPAGATAISTACGLEIRDTAQRGKAATKTGQLSGWLQGVGSIFGRCPVLVAALPKMDLLAVLSSAKHP
jgi:hypothetical protein